MPLKVKRVKMFGHESELTFGEWRNVWGSEDPLKRGQRFAVLFDDL